MANISIKQAIKMAAAASKNYTDSIAATKVTVVPGKALSDNNLTDDMIDKYEAAYTHSVAAHLTLGTSSSTAFRGDQGLTAYNHSQAAHAPSNAQKNSDITKSEIEAKLTGTITSHNHSGTYAPASHNQASNTITAMTGYSKPSSTSAIATTDSLNAAIGKLEKALDGKQASGSYSPAGHNHNDVYYTETEVDTLLDGKADASHGDHVIYATTAPKANGTAAVGTVNRVAREDHVHPLQTEISGNAGSANKVNTSIKIQLNGGTTEGTDQFTFNGSTAKTVDITPAGIGASEDGHAHNDLYYTETEINGKISTINTAISNAQSAAQSYADTKIAALVNSAPEAMNTLKELADAIDAHQDVYEAYVEEVSSALSGKADSSHGNHVPTTQTANNAVFLRNDNTWATVTPSNIGAAPTSHASTATTYGAASASNYGHAMASSTTPKANGTAALGSETAKFARGDHVHPLQVNVSGSSGSCTGNAASATKVGNSLSIALNGGTTEGTNLFTFNGSAAKSINITPAAIGAAISDHGTHVTWATNAPSANGTASVGSVARVAREDHVHPLQTTVSGNAGSANKVNNNLVVKLNGGSTEGTDLFTFNGSAAKSINITPSAIGAAASEHGTHVTYATTAPLVAGTASAGSASTVARTDHVHPAQTSVSGNAGTATKLKTARDITIGNKTNSFNGTAGITFTLADIGIEEISDTELSGILTEVFGQ